MDLVNSKEMRRAWRIDYTSGKLGRFLAVVEAPTLDLALTRAKAQLVNTTQLTEHDVDSMRSHISKAIGYVPSLVSLVPMPKGKDDKAAAKNLVNLAKGEDLTIYYPPRLPMYNSAAGEESMKLVDVFDIASMESEGYKLLDSVDNACRPLRVS